MSRDIRIAISFKGHRKRKRLRRIIGDRADGYLIDLWISTAIDCPTGILIDWDIEDISDASGWGGNPEEFVDALIDSKWLEKNKDNNYILHDWREHQGWVCNAPQRSASAKKAAKARWEGKNGVLKKPINKESNAGSNAGRNAVGNAGRNAPSPSPYPSPSPSLKESPTKTKPKLKKFEPPKKDISGLKSGTFKPPKTTTKKQFKFENLPGIFISIKNKCEKINILQSIKPKKKTFDPILWVQSHLKTKKHPEALLKSLDGLEIYWGQVRDVWSYCDNILGKVNGSFNESDAIKIHTKIKQISIPELSELTAGLFEEI